MISVIIPVFNTKPYLARCLDSVVNQTFSDLEIILIDDGSTDGSSEACDEYALVDSRIKVIHKRNEGLVRARKDGISNSTGQFIAYVDSDDWIETNMIEHMYSYLVEENVDIVMCGRYEDTGDISREVFQGIAEGRYDKNGLLKYVYPNMVVNGAFFEWGVFPGVWDKLFRRNCLEKYQMLVDDRITMGEDAACTYPCLLNANSIYILHECLYHYRQTVTSMVKQVQNFEVQRMRFSILYNSVNELFEKYRDIYDLRQQWKEYVLFLMVPRADILCGYLSSYSDGNHIALDDVIDQPVNFIKMDIEGNEWDALNGAIELVRRSQNLRLSICSYHRDVDQELIESFMRKNEIQYEHSKGYMWFPYTLGRGYVTTKLTRGVIRGKKE